MGEPLKYLGINSIGLARNNFSSKEIFKIKKAYKVLYRSEYNVSQAVSILREEYSNDRGINEIIKFIDESTRGII